MARLWAPLGANWFEADRLRRGLIGVTAMPRGWEGIVNGRLKQVDLDRLITDQFPHKLSDSPLAAGSGGEHQHAAVDDQFAIKKAARNRCENIANWRSASTSTPTA